MIDPIDVLIQRAFGGMSKEERAVYAWNVMGSEDFGLKTSSGINLTEEKALTFSVVWAAVNLIADGVAALPPRAFQDDNEDDSIAPQQTRLPRWIRRPHPEVRRFDINHQLIMSMLLWGNGYAYFIRRPSDDVIVGLSVIDPSTVTCRWNPDNSGTRQYKVDNGPWLTSHEVFHVQGPALPGQACGMSVIGQAREAIALGLTLEDFGARYFSQGSQAKVVIELPQTLPNEESARSIVSTYEKFHRGRANWHRPAVISGGAKLHNITIPPDDSQFLESRGFQAIEIARWFRVPPHRVGIIDKGTSWGSGLVEENLAMLQYTFKPWIIRMEAAYTAYTPGGQDNGLIIRLDDAELMRGTFADQVEVQSTLYEKLLVTKNEARHALGLEDAPDGEGDEFFDPAAAFSHIQSGGDSGGTGPNNGGAATKGGPDGPTRTPEKDRIRKQKEAGRDFQMPGRARRFNPNHDNHGRFTSGGLTASLSDDQAVDLHARVNTPDGGFTIDAVHGTNAVSGFAVATHPERSRQIPVNEVTPEGLQKYVLNNADLLSRPDHKFGGWHDPATGLVWLDVSQVKADFPSALKLAKEHNQIAVFDLKTGMSINTGGTGAAKTEPRSNEEESYGST